MRRSGAVLQGDLAVFAPELLFQLMALAHATGRLTLQKDDLEVTVLFHEGQLRFASGAVGPEARLGDTLVRVGRLAPKDRENAVRAWRRARGAKRLGTILVERGLLGRSELEEFIQEQIKNRIVEVLRWKSGAFHFETVTSEAGSPPGEDIVLDVQLDHLLLECMTRLDEAPAPAQRRS